MSTPIPVPPPPPPPSAAGDTTSSPPPNPADNVRTKDESSLAPFNPSCDQAQFKSLELLDLSADDDVLFDLGCGDGRMLINAAQKIPGLRCVGIELDPVFVKRGQEALRKLPPSVQRRVDIRQGDLLQTMGELERPPKNDDSSSEDDNDDNDNLLLGKDCKELTFFEHATAVYLFLLPKGIKKIQPLLDAVRDKRILEKKKLYLCAYFFSIRAWEPVSVDKTTKGEAPLYLYKCLADGS